MGDGAYAMLFDELLRPIADRFAPDLVLVSAGFDAHRLDPLAQMQVTSERALLAYAVLYGISRRNMPKESQPGSGVGGYHLDALSESVAYCADILTGATAPGAISPTSSEYRFVSRLVSSHRGVSF